MKAKYAHLVDKIVVCRWIDITSYKVDNLDNFLLTQEGQYSNQSIIFITHGIFRAEDDNIIIITPTYAQKNKFVKERKADIEAIPKACILEIEQLDFIDCEEKK